MADELEDPCYDVGDEHPLQETLVVHALEDEPPDECHSGHEHCHSELSNPFPTAKATLMLM